MPGVVQPFPSRPLLENRSNLSASVKSWSHRGIHPERMASRILGMGDVLSLIEKAQEALDEKKAAELEQKILQKPLYPTGLL